MSIDLDNYVDVPERITKFYERYPEGSLRCGGWDIRSVEGQTFFIYRALAYRTPDDSCPGEGVAWEPVPGKTPYTKDSEAMNAETSAWGRAIAALGIATHRGIASQNEVRNRQNGDSPEPATEGQHKYLYGGGGRTGLFDLAQLTEAQRSALTYWGTGTDELTKAAASRLIEALVPDESLSAEERTVAIEANGRKLLDKLRGDESERAQKAQEILFADVEGADLEGVR